MSKRLFVTVLSPSEIAARWPKNSGKPRSWLSSGAHEGQLIRVHFISYYVDFKGQAHVSYGVRPPLPFELARRDIGTAVAPEATNLAAFGSLSGEFPADWIPSTDPDEPVFGGHIWWPKFFAELPLAFSELIEYQTVSLPYWVAYWRHTHDEELDILAIPTDTPLNLPHGPHRPIRWKE